MLDQLKKIPKIFWLMCIIAFFLCASAIKLQSGEQLLGVTACINASCNLSKLWAYWNSPQFLGVEDILLSGILFGMALVFTIILFSNRKKFISKEKRK